MNIHRNTNHGEMKIVWLLVALTKDIRSLFLQLGTSQEVWDAIKQTYSVGQGASKAYQLHCEVTSSITYAMISTRRDLAYAMVMQGSLEGFKMGTSIWVSNMEELGVVIARSHHVL